jgi:predicted nicotinamide N-methyase
LAESGVTVLMGDPGRAYLPRKGLVEMARYQVPTSIELEDKDMRLTLVWRLKSGVES